MAWQNDPFLARRGIARLTTERLLIYDLRKLEERSEQEIQLYPRGFVVRGDSRFIRRRHREQELAKHCHELE